MSLISPNFFSGFQIPAVYDSFFDHDRSIMNYRGLDSFNELLNPKFSYPPIDLYENEKDYTIHCSVPGVNPNKIEVTYHEEHQQVIIKGEYKESRKQVAENIKIRERQVGSFERRITLPLAANQCIDSESIKANLGNGILDITIPKIEKTLKEPKKISVSIRQKAEKSPDTKDEPSDGPKNLVEEASTESEKTTETSEASSEEANKKCCC